MIKEIVDNALKALLYEAVTLPKPGLVDPVDQGSHPDMDIYTFIDSSVALAPYLNKAAQIGEEFKGHNLTQMFQKLRQEGILAETEMLRATQAVNTHKGAIFSLGIFVCAQSYAKKHEQDIFEVIKKMCRGLIHHDLSTLNKKHLTAGEEQYVKYQIGGVRELAERGYPIVRDSSLPYLKMSQGTINQRLLDTLMKIASQADDTTFVKRAQGRQTLAWLHEISEKFLKLGGSKTQAGMQFLKEENAIFKEHDYTIGGCADLLIVTIFMALEENSL
ncbi:triphosphoribosyl-dephospho-CoA synthase [Lactobacillus intestinalis]|uniref:triphosphoribosyl-dephospho-CoA synthase n=1 Tax=Lactobacillus intestinalis TaxID=151781 RepID=UPI00242A5392|nr:triphosphoribosyl-dephospho-CoA synthase [Lactobacillus intestinalis]